MALSKSFGIGILYLTCGMESVFSFILSSSELSVVNISSTFSSRLIVLLSDLFNVIDIFLIVGFDLDNFDVELVSTISLGLDGDSVLDWFAKATISKASFFPEDNVLLLSFLSLRLV